MSEKPVIAFALGDPAGIGAELAAKVIAGDNRDAAILLVLGDARLLAEGARQAGVTIDLPTVSVDDFGARRPTSSIMVDLQNCDASTIALGRASAEGGHAALDNFRCALAAADAGFADAVFFTPFNKAAMRMAESDYVDEIGFVSRALHTDENGSEFNVLDEVWNARVTSHIPLSEVAGAIDTDRVFKSLRLTNAVMEGAGYTRPRIGVAALNPHAGDGRNFGTEDDDIILPAVERAAAHQMAVTGPVPSDTVFVRAMRGEFDAVLTMYHDQGQIAMKLIGFDRGVTLIAGYPFPIVTPAHGTAYDIAGQGVANDGATSKALLLGAKLARDPAAASGPHMPLSIVLDHARAMAHAAEASAAASSGFAAFAPVA